MTAKHDHDDLDREAIAKAVDEVVNMVPAALERWLGSPEGQMVGWVHDGESEAVGHQEGRRIVAIKRTRKVDLGHDDHRHMRKVVGYVRRHLAQGGPARDARDSRWRYWLMNWGHGPEKD